MLIRRRDGGLHGCGRLMSIMCWGRDGAMEEGMLSGLVLVIDWRVIG